jgi:alcohol dehydrogenase class IV
LGIAAVQFDFATASRIVFGPGTAKEMVPAAASFGRRALFVMGKSSERALTWIEKLRADGFRVAEFHMAGEPTVETVLTGMEEARSEACEVIIGMGGGSVIDAGKAVATLVANPGPVYDYLEVVGKGRPLVHQALPFVAVPTTAGTGSEVTRNAVLGVTEKRVKVSLRGSQMLPKVAIVDPELTCSLPPEVTATSGMDALTQLIEPFLSAGANAITDAICRDGIGRVRRSLKAAFNNGEDRRAREDMSLAALFGGMALANARLGAVHGFAGPIGGMYPVGHGAVCARLLPVVMEANLAALRERTPQAPILVRFKELAAILTGNPGAAAEEGIEWLYELREALQIRPLAAYGVRQEDMAEIITRARQANSMKGNSVALNEAELEGIVESAL